MHVYTLTLKYMKKKVIPFAITWKEWNTLGVNLAKEVKNLYIEKCKTVKT